MKLIRFREANKEKPGVVLGDDFYDVSSFGEDFNEQFFESDGLTRLEQFVEQNKAQLTKLAADIPLASPIARPSKIICIGLNYIDHARETGATPPTEPRRPTDSAPGATMRAVGLRAALPTRTRRRRLQQRPRPGRGGALQSRCQFPTSHLSIGRAGEELMDA